MCPLQAHDVQIATAFQSRGAESAGGTMEYARVGSFDVVAATLAKAGRT